MMGQIWPKTCLLAMAMLGAVAAQAESNVSYNTLTASNPSWLIKTAYASPRDVVKRTSQLLNLAE